MRYAYVGIDSIFSKLIRDVTSDFNERDVIEWCAEALDATNSVKSYEEAVAFIEVKNHQCSIPRGAHSIIQIARDIRYDPMDYADTSGLCPSLVTTSIAESTTDNSLSNGPVDIGVALDCNGEPINDYELAYYRPYFDLKAEYLGWTSCGLYRKRYLPVRLSTSTFGVSNLICKEINSEEIYRYADSEYTVIQSAKMLRFSFKEGAVAVAYNRQVVDPQTGYPMIPDNYSYREAITRYIKMKLLDRACYSGRQGTCGLADKAAQDWQWYCAQSSAVDLMPHGVDEHQNLLDQRSYFLPNNNRYFGFFGNLASPESKRYNHPNGY